MKDGLTRNHQQLTTLKAAINLTVNLGNVAAAINLLKSAGFCPQNNSPSLADLITINLHDLDIPALERFLSILFEKGCPEPAIRFACNNFYRILHSDRQDSINSPEASPDKLCVQDYRIFYRSRLSTIESESDKNRLATQLLDHASKNLDRGDFLYLITSPGFPFVNFNWTFEEYVLRNSSSLKNIESSLYGLITYVSSEEDSHLNKIEAKNSWSKKGLAGYENVLELFTNLPWVKDAGILPNNNRTSWSGYDVPYSDISSSKGPFTTNTLVKYSDNRGKKRLMQSLEITGIIESLCRKLGRAIVVLDVGGYYGNSLLLSGFNDSWDCIKKWIVADIPEVCDVFPDVIENLNSINPSPRFKEQSKKLECITLDSLYGNSDLKNVDLIYTCSSLLLEPRLAQRVNKWVSLSPSRIFIHQMDYILESDESESFFQVWKPFSEVYWFLYSAQYIRRVLSNALENHSYKIQEFHSFEQGLKTAFRVPPEADLRKFNPCNVNFDLQKLNVIQYAVGRKSMQIDLL